MPPVDRGDDFVPTPDEDKKSAAAAAAPEAKPEEGDKDKASKAVAPEAKPEGDDAKPEGDDAKPEGEDARIPKARLDKEIQRRKLAEERAAERIKELESQIQAQRRSASAEALEKKIAELDDQYDDAIADGEKAKAKQIKAEIRKLERDLNRVEANQQALQAKIAAVSELKYDMALSQIEIDYPQLNPDGDSFDKEVAEEVSDLLDAYKIKGLSPDVALKKAVRYVLGPPKAVVEAAAKDLERDGLRRARAEDARRKVAEAAKAAPASTKDLGEDSDRRGGGMPKALEISKMSQAQFAKLDEEVLRKARGDDL